MATSLSMPIIGPDARLQVVVGVALDKHDRCLIQQRPEGKICSGQWEFPGGKIESGETALQALVREFKEELGITVNSARFLAEIQHDYDHANVCLSVYIVQEFTGTPQALEKQNFDWAVKSDISSRNVLEAVFPILDYL